MPLILLVLALASPTVPGAIRPLSVVQVCTIRWGVDVRHVTLTMKREAAKRDGIKWEERGRYLADHLVPRELAGADTLGNIWFQPIDEAKQKDRAENFLHREVCAGRVALVDAQQQMMKWGR